MQNPRQPSSKILLSTLLEHEKPKHQLEKKNKNNLIFIFTIILRWIYNFELYFQKQVKKSYLCFELLKGGSLRIDGSIRSVVVPSPGFEPG